MLKKRQRKLNFDSDDSYRYNLAAMEILEFDEINDELDRISQDVSLHEYTRLVDKTSYHNHGLETSLTADNKSEK